MQICYTALNSKSKIKKVEGWGRACSSFHFKPRERFPVGPSRNFNLLLILLKSTVDQWQNTCLPGKVREQRRGADWKVIFWLTCIPEVGQGKEPECSLWIGYWPHGRKNQPRVTLIPIQEGRMGGQWVSKMESLTEWKMKNWGLMGEWWFED